MRRLKRVAALALRSCEASGLLDLLERGEGGRRGVLRVLTYHRVGAVSDRSLYPALVSASPDAFARQMRWIAARHRVVSLREVLHSRRTGEPLPPRALLVTFDDAYADFAEHAWPVLSALGLPVALFVPTAYPDQPERAFWWDRLFRSLDRSPRDACHASPLGRLPLSDAGSRMAAFRRLRELVMSLPAERGMQLVDALVEELGDHPLPNPVLGWDALRRLARQGVELCAHTRSHPALDRLEPEEARREIAGSRADLQREIGESLPVFAYPAGRFDWHTPRLLAEEGFELAFTTHRGIDRLATADPLRLRRVPVTPRASEAVLRAQLLGLTAGLRPLTPVPAP